MRSCQCGDVSPPRAGNIIFIGGGGGLFKHVHAVKGATQLSFDVAMETGNGDNEGNLISESSR